MRAERGLSLVLLAVGLASIILVALMAARSPIDAHPDEELHLAATAYFRDWLLPPPVGDSRAAATYGPWGMSYVDEADAVYVAFGRAAALGTRLGLPLAMSVRIFQVTLYVALVAWVLARARAFAPALALLVLTPQVWYVFSYANADALPFLLLSGLLLELAAPHSGIRAFLRGDPGAGATAGAAWGALLGLLLLSKRNYLVSIGFVGFALVWLRWDVASWKRVVVPVVAAAAVAAPWAGYHAWVNEFQTGSRVLEYADRIAVLELRPSLASHASSAPYVGLRAKGAPFLALFTHLDWGWISFRSFSGVYGWMNVVGVPWIYRCFGALDALLLAVILVPALLRRRSREQLLVLVFVTSAVAVVGQSAYRSWILHFQPQGRYLFPILPMLLFCWQHCEDPRLRALALFCAAALGALSLLSFVFIGVVTLA